MIAYWFKLSIKTNFIYFFIFYVISRKFLMTYVAHIVSVDRFRAQ